jgi:hypothetical protein
VIGPPLRWTGEIRYRQSGCCADAPTGAEHGGCVHPRKWDSWEERGRSGWNRLAFLVHRLGLLFLGVDGRLGGIQRAGSRCSGGIGIEVLEGAE